MDSCDAIFASLDGKLDDPHTVFFIYYGIYLWVKNNQAIGKSHFQLALDAESLPARSVATYLLHPNVTLDKLFENAFVYEKIQVLRYLELFYLALGKQKKAQECRKHAEDALEEQMN